MTTKMPVKAKGVFCPFCCGTKFRSRTRYRPLVNVKIVYAECARCAAHLKFKVQLVWAKKPASSPKAG